MSSNGICSDEFSDYFKDIKEEYYCSESNESKYDKLYSRKASDNFPTDLPAVENFFPSSSDNHHALILPKENEFGDLNLTNLVDEFWDSGYGIKDDIEGDVNSLSMLPKNFGIQNFTNCTEKSRWNQETHFSESNFNIFPDIKLKECTKNLLKSDMLISNCINPDSLKEIKSNTKEDSCKFNWSSPFDFERLHFSDDEKERETNNIIRKNEFNFSMSDYDLDSFLSSPTNDISSKEHGSVSVIKSDIRIHNPEINKVLTGDNVMKKVKLINEEEIDSNDEEEKWENMFEQALPSILQEPKINQKVMKKIKAKSLIGLRRVKYAITGNSTQSSEKTCGSETICFATQPAAKSYMRKCSKKDVNKVLSCSKGNSLDKKFLKTINEQVNVSTKVQIFPVGQSNLQVKDAEHKNVSSKFHIFPDCLSNEQVKVCQYKNISTVSQIFPSVSQSNKQVKAGQQKNISVIVPASQAGCHNSQSVLTGSKINTLLPSVKTATVNKSSFLTPWSNMLPISDSSASANSYKNAEQNFYPYKYVAPKLEKTLKNVNKINLHPVKKISKIGNNLINLKNIVKIEIYTKHPKKMVITKSNTEPLKSISRELKKSGPSDDKSKVFSEMQKQVKRPLLTSSELDCTERQEELLRLLKELKNAPHYCNNITCDICKDVAMIEHELLKLQKKADEGIKLNYKPTLNVKLGHIKDAVDPSKYGMLKNFKLVRRQNQEDDNALSNSTNIKDAPPTVEEEELRDGLMLYISDGGSDPIVQTQNKTFQSLKSLEKSRQWEKAMQYKNLSLILKEHFQSQRRVTPSDDCICDDNCRSFLTCACASKVSVCIDCGCASCENPFYAFEAFAIDLQAVKADPCLLQTVYDIGLNELLVKLNEDCTVPCCNRKLKLYQIVPNVAECLHCGTFLSYSWCQKLVRDEKVYQRNHCAICGTCHQPLRSHCHLCENCTLSCVSGKCLNCKTEKVFSGISLA